MRKLSSLLFSIGCLFALGLWAPSALARTPKLQAAVELYEEAEFDKARASLSRLLYPQTSLGPDETLDAHAYLAATLLAFDDEETAKKELRALLELKLDYELPRVFDPRLRSLAEKIGQELRAARAAAAPPPPPPAKAASKSAFRWHRLLPYGVAQFVDRRPAWGTVYAILGLGSLGGNLAMGKLLKDQNDAGSCARNCQRLQLTQNLLFGAVIAVGVWSVIEAFLFAPEPS